MIMEAEFWPFQLWYTPSIKRASRWSPCKLLQDVLVRSIRLYRSQSLLESNQAFFEGLLSVVTRPSLLPTHLCASMLEPGEQWVFFAKMSCILEIIQEDSAKTKTICTRDQFLLHFLYYCSTYSKKKRSIYSNWELLAATRSPRPYLTPANEMSEMVERKVEGGYSILSFHL